MEAFYLARGDRRRWLYAYYDASLPDAGGPAPEGESQSFQGEETSEEPTGKPEKRRTAAPVIVVDQQEEPSE